MQLIYEKAGKAKVSIIKLLLKNKGKIKKEELLNDLTISLATLEKYLSEMKAELPESMIGSTNDIVFIDKNSCSIYRVKHIYLSNSISSEILKYCFHEEEKTLEQLAQKLFISTSKLFNVLKFLEEELKCIDVTIVRTPTVLLKGNSDAILLLYNLVLHTEKTPCNRSFSQLNESELYGDIKKFFQANRIKVENRVIKEFGLWLVALNDRRFLNRFGYSDDCLSISKGYFKKQSPIFISINNFFPGYKYKGMDESGCCLALAYLIFNPIGIHFETLSDERFFYSSNVQVKFEFQDLILSMLLGEEYQITSESIHMLAIKIEGSIHYHSLITLYLTLYGDLLNLEFGIEEEKQKWEALFKEKCNFVSKYGKPRVPSDKVVEFLLFILQAFKKGYFKKSILTVGVCSIRGSAFEEKLCQQLTSVVRFQPYHKVKNSTDVLIVDDLRLLDTEIYYKEHILIEDSNSIGLVNY